MRNFWNGGSSGGIDLSIFQDMGEPTGFPIIDGEVDHSSSSISFDDITRTFTIQATADIFNIYQNGTKYERTLDQIIIDDIEGLWHIYYNEGSLVATQTFSSNIILKYVYVANIYWDSTNKKSLNLGEERHGTIPGQAHLDLHENIGTYIEGNGGALDNFVIGDGSLDSHFNFSIGDVIIRDEDIKISHLGIDEFNGMNVFYNDNTEDNPYLRLITSNVAKFLNAGTGRVAYNLLSGGNWSVEEANEGYYVLYHIFAINDRTNRYSSIMGINQYQYLVDARDGINNEIVLLENIIPFQEFSLLGTVILQTSSSYTNSNKARIVQTLTGGNYKDWRKSNKAKNGLPIINHNNLANRSNRNAHPSSAIEFLSDGKANVNTVKDIFDNYLSSAVMSGFELTDNKDGTINVSSGEIILRNGSADDDELRNYVVEGMTNISLTDNMQNYVIVNYNSGSPQIEVITDITTVNGNDTLPLHLMTRVGSNVYTESIRFFTNNAIKKFSEKSFYLEGYRHRPGGTVISDNGSMSFEVTAGSFYLVNNEIEHPSYSSLIDNFTYVYRGLTGYTRVTGSTVIDYLHYDDGTGTLALVSNNKYINHYVYIVLDNAGDNPHLFVMYGRTQHNTLADAQAATIPTTLPPEFSSSGTGVFIGRITVNQNNGTSFANIQTPFLQQLYSSSPTSHNGLTDLQLAQIGVTYGHVSDQSQTYSGAKTFTNQATFNGGIVVNGDIVVNGSTYETHAEHLYTTKDQITLRDGAIAGLGSGEYTGLIAKLYDGTNDGQLIFDNSGIARVGDLGSTQALATREDTPTSMGLMVWDSATLKLTTYSNFIFNTSTNYLRIDTGVGNGGIEFDAFGAANIVNSFLELSVNASKNLNIRTNGAQPVILSTNYTERARFNGTTGNFSIGGTGDDGNKLQVYGNTRVYKLRVGELDDSSNVQAQTITWGKEGYNAPGNFNTSSTGDKIILWDDGTSTDTRIGLSSTDAVWIKSMGSGSTNAFAVHGTNATSGLPNRLFTVTKSGNILLQTYPSETWISSLTAFQIGGNASITADNTAGAGKYFHVVQNAYVGSGSSAWEYQDTDEASKIQMANGEILLSTAASGTADTAVTWFDTLRIKADGYAYLERIQTGTGTTLVRSNTDGQLLALSSSVRYKKNIREYSYNSEDVLKLNVVEYEYKGTGDWNSSPTAEQSFEVARRYVYLDKDKNPDSLADRVIMFDMLQVIQRQQKKIEELEKLIKI